MSDLLTVEETAAILRVTRWTVGAMTRDGRLPRVPGLRRTRIPRYAVERLVEGYDWRDEPIGQAPAKAPAPRRGNRRAAQGSLAGEAVDSGHPVHGRIGPSPGDVVVRRVEGRGR